MDGAEAVAGAAGATSIARPLRVTIVGAGAMGSLYGGRLADAGQRVLLYARRAEQAAALRERGLTIEELDGRVTTRPIAATADPGEAAAGADLLIVLVKTTDTAAALGPFRGRLGADALLLTLQNGLGNEAAIRAAPGEGIDLALGTTAAGALTVGPGRVRHTGVGPAAIGYPDRGVDGRLAAVAAALSGAGLPATATGRIAGAIWAKLLVNAAINPVTALTGLRNGELPETPGLAALLRGIVAEAASVQRAAAPETVEAGDPFARVLATCAATAANRSSMLQDIAADRPTEIDAINGAIVALGARHGIATPLNAALVALVHGRESSVASRQSPEGTG